MRIFSIAFIFLLSAGSWAQAAGPKATPLLQSDITGVPSHQALMTRVELPANATLPMHYHPTEEFMYVIAGEAFLRIEGQEDKLISAGTSGKIPAGMIHTAVTRDKAAEVVVFRVHPKGQPVRTVPDQQK
ncbi:cupin domain-containing protein [Kordiimonas aquimaris]|uniref:cupin domain-containing protein n=1 Tax=Kordiimonas aquimaris TaxID=707591 RepID=UPI0021CE8DBE|nr:cupin domain-containing protein [Kordiimonas aquimaris]